MVYGSGHNVSGRKLSPLIEASHKALAIRQLQYGAFPSKRLGNQEGFCLWVVKACGMKLIKFHVGDTTASTPGAGYAITACSVWIGCINVSLAGAACSEHNCSSAKGMYLVGLSIKHVGTNALFAVVDEVDDTVTGQ